MTTHHTLTATATLTAYLATIPAANWAITHHDAVPVGLGYAAPAGVYMAGLALVLRDIARNTAGRLPVLAAMAAGVVLSYWLADPALGAASAVAFAVSELADFAVYEPLRRRGMVLAVAASNAVGLLVDSLLFLWLAFGSFAFLPGQVLGKAWMTMAAIMVIAVLQRRRAAVTA